MIICIGFSFLFFTTDRTIAKINEEQYPEHPINLNSLTIADLDWVACDIDNDLRLSFTPRTSGGYSTDKTDNSLHAVETSGTYAMYVGWYTSFEIIDEVFQLEFEVKVKAGHSDAVNLRIVIADNISKTIL